MTCSRCSSESENTGQRYCRKCRASYSRDYRRVQKRLTVERVRRMFVDALELVGDWSAADSVRNARVQ